MTSWKWIKGEGKREQKERERFKWSGRKVSRGRKEKEMSGTKCWTKEAKFCERSRVRLVVATIESLSLRLESWASSRTSTVLDSRRPREIEYNEKIGRQSERNGESLRERERSDSWIFTSIHFNWKEEREEEKNEFPVGQKHSTLIYTHFINSIHSFIDFPLLLFPSLFLWLSIPSLSPLVDPLSLESPFSWQE